MSVSGHAQLKSSRSLSCGTPPKISPAFLGSPMRAVPSPDANLGLDSAVQQKIRVK
jgi:hypothetical protein